MVFLEALRATLVRSGMLVAVCSLAAWPMAEGIVRYLARGISAQLVAFGLPEAFFAFMALSLATGLFAAAPYLLYTVFWPLPDLFPGLNRRQAAVLWLIATLLFYAGALFCLGITLPYGIDFLLGYQDDTVAALISVRRFVSFCSLLVFGFAAAFELPLAMMVLGRIGLLDVRRLAAGRRYAILAVTVAAAILTPTPDIFNLCLMAVPLYLLFELGLVGMRLFKAPVAEPRADTLAG
jgi:sec-independent protein translocase protein TatC